MKRKTRLVSLVAAAALLIAMTAGCSGGGGSAESVSPSASSPAASTPAAQTPAASESSGPAENTQGMKIAGDDLSMFPISDKTVTLTAWSVCDINDRPTGIMTTPADVSAMRYIEKLTNVHIDFTFVMQNMAREQFPIMQATGDWCDIIGQASMFLAGGLQEGLNQDFLMDLSPYVEKNMPHYWAFLNEDKTHYASAVLDDGRIGGIWAFHNEILPSWGLCIRQDWLNKLSLKTPRTYGELEDVMKAFKAEYDCSSTFLLTQSLQPAYYLAGGYGVAGYQLQSLGIAHSHMYQDGGKVTSSFVQDGYKEYLQMLNKWYNEGLVSSDFASISFFPIMPDNYNYYVDNKSGVGWNNVNLMGDLKNYSTDPDFELAGISDPVKKVGDVTHFQTQNTIGEGAASLSTSCKDVDSALKFLDYFYTKDAIVLCDYGVLDENWHTVDGGPIKWEDMENGNVEWDKDLIYGAAEKYGIAPQAAVKDYIFGTALGTGISIEKRLFQFYDKTMKDTFSIWNEHVDGSGLLPKISFSTDEQSRVNTILADIETYASENIALFINGTKPFSEWQDFVAQVNKLGMPEAMSIYQDALDRYNAKFG